MGKRATCRATVQALHEVGHALPSRTRRWPSGVDQALLDAAPSSRGAVRIADFHGLLLMRAAAVSMGMAAWEWPHGNAPWVGLSPRSFALRGHDHHSSDDITHDITIQSVLEHF